LDAGKIFVNVNVPGGFRYDIFGKRRVPVSVFRVKIAASKHLTWVTGRVFRVSK
jgi:hypothetical protein